MSYPDPVYVGETGEATATFRATSHDPEVLYPNGARCHFLATGATTRGLFGLYRMDLAVTGSGPGPHFHRTFQESFFVLSGEIKIFDGRDWRKAQTGDFVHVPEGGIHGFRNEPGAPASLLIHFAPGAPREAYFQEQAEFASTLPSDEELAEFYLRHDNHWVDG